MKLRIFVACPSDVAAERDEVRPAVATFEPLISSLGLEVEVVDWRQAPMDLGRPEDTILTGLPPASWAVFIGILWHRFGTPPGAIDPVTQTEYRSGFEEEFSRAYELKRKHNQLRIWLYRCEKSLPYDFDQKQFELVTIFFSECLPPGKHPCIFYPFVTTDEFKSKLLRELLQLLIAYGHTKDITIDTTTLRPSYPDNLLPIKGFFGRTAELSDVLSALDLKKRSWGVIIKGIGGIGKTTLAIEAAHQCKDNFKAFVFVMARKDSNNRSASSGDPQSMATLDALLNETARLLRQPGIAQFSLDEKLELLREALSTTPTLLIYNNLEALPQTEEKALLDFLEHLPPASKAIVTTRRDVHKGDCVSLEGLKEEAFCEMLENEAMGDVTLRKKVGKAGRADWLELLRQLGGSPLALRHILGLMRDRDNLTFDGALQMLSRRPARPPDPDLQKLHEFIFGEALKELNQSDVAVLKALWFFTPSAPPGALAAAAKLTQKDLETSLRHLTALFLVETQTQTDGGRYTFHPITRRFVGDNLMANPQIARDAGMSFASYWMGYAEINGRENGPEFYKQFGRLEEEWANLATTASWLEQRADVRGGNIGDEDAARCLNEFARSLRLFLEFRGHWKEYVQLSTDAYKVMQKSETWKEAGWRAYDVAYIYYARDDSTDAALWANHCTRMWDAEGSPQYLARAKQIQGLVARGRKDYRRAESMLNDALTTFRQENNPGLISNTLLGLGGVFREQERFSEAEEKYREALRVLDQVQHKAGVARIHNSMGYLAVLRGQWDAARRELTMGLQLAEEVGHLELIAGAKSSLARVEQHVDQVDLAMLLAEQALGIYDRLHHKYLGATKELIKGLKALVGATSG